MHIKIMMMLLLLMNCMHAGEHITNAIGYFEDAGNRLCQEDCSFYRYVRSQDMAIDRGHLLGVLDGYNGPDVALCAAIALPTLFESTAGDIVHKLESAFAKYDKTLVDADNKKCGATGTVVFIKNNIIHIAQLGITGALVEKNGKFDFVTQKHLPNDPDEKKRIEAAGGHVEYYKNAWRIEKCLLTSRALGTHFGDMKKFISAEPACTQYQCAADNRYLILATSEFWRVMNNEEILSLLQNAHTNAKQSGCVVVPRMLAWILGDTAKQKKAGNVTVKVVDLLLLARSNCAQTV